jgi:glycerol-3-phosphate dehydrogenase (NAD(P)+)
VTIAAESEHLAKDLQEAIGLRRFRPYISTDMIGAQLGGSLKNVIAIAAGIVAGKNMGDSARAALITRGLAEIVRLCVAKGGKRETLLGMCGVGDLMLTCSSMQSRNYSLGFALGEGKTLADIMAGRNSVTEGVYTAQAALKMAKKNAVDLPITEAVYACLHDGMPIEKAMEDMLNRPFKY